MSLTATPHDLHDRLDQATAVSTAARRRAARAVAVAVDVHARAVDVYAWAQRVRLDSVDARARRRGPARAETAVGSDNDHPVRAFRVEGVVDGVPTHARWSARGLECSPTLLQRIEIIVAMGETFDPGGGRPPVEASLDGPLKAVLPTVIRALSSVTSIELSVGQLASQSETS
jgi:hypothetical protein